MLRTARAAGKYEGRECPIHEIRDAPNPLLHRLNIEAAHERIRRGGWRLIKGLRGANRISLLSASSVMCPFVFCYLALFTMAFFHVGWHDL